MSSATFYRVSRLYPQWNPYEEVLEIHGYGPQGDQRLAVIALDVISHNELGLTDVNTGEELPSLVFGDDSITASELRDHVIGSGIMIETSVGLATAGGDVEFMAVPWSRPSRLKLAPLGDSVYALLEYREGDTVRYDAWATSDGRTWSLLVAGLFADRDATTVDVVPGHDVLFAILREASDGFGAEPVSLWIIHDGVAWDRVEAPALSEISISAFNSGYAMVDFSGLWLSDDGVEWHAIDSDEIGFDIGPPSEDGDWSSDVAGDTIFVTSRSFAQDRVTRWVFTLESDP